MYSRQYGNPYAAQRAEPPSEYNIRQEVRNDKPTKGMKYLEGYGWFEGEELVDGVLRRSWLMVYSAGGSARCASYGFPYIFEYICSTTSISPSGTLPATAPSSR